MICLLRIYLGGALEERRVLKGKRDEDKLSQCLIYALWEGVCPAILQKPLLAEE
ncbi:hypothetical protein FOXB_17673 [Fusarium oxysporum f. sp. conglutinans Fo5176]|uniref:Uncharacterized protein n=1 Tax=Fusarium oxysporum (strain Fo5176) TaxID=660025 RepID=F9GG89_FUSOF|nr:hypothetical protein FOXB_17673 [Fusarium oxysporum f. sp. conglutinans Fo5176]